MALFLGGTGLEDVALVFVMKNIEPWHCAHPYFPKDFLYNHYG